MRRDLDTVAAVAVICSLLWAVCGMSVLAMSLHEHSHHAISHDHQAAIRTVLERYGIEDLTAPLAAGDYGPELLDGLHADLIAQGSLSLEDALAAAILIEQVDIDDLKAKMAGLEETAPDVFNMYSHLLTASGHHLAAFESQL